MYDYPGTSINKGNWFHETNWKQAFINPVYEIHVKGLIYSKTYCMIKSTKITNLKFCVKTVICTAKTMDSECTKMQLQDFTKCHVTLCFLWLKMMPEWSSTDINETYVGQRHLYSTFIDKKWGPIFSTSSEVFLKQWKILRSCHNCPVSATLVKILTETEFGRKI